MKVRRLINYFLKLRRSFKKISLLDFNQITLYQYFKGLKQDKEPPQATILVQCVEDSFFFGLFGQIVVSLREQQSVRVEQFILRSLNVGESESFWIFTKIRCVISKLYSRKWVALYSSFCDSVGYNSTSVQPFSDLVDLYRAWRCWREVNTKKILINLVIDDVLVGDLVNDSYLRFKPAPTVNFKDRYLWIVIWQTYRDVRRAKEYFLRVKPKVYLTSYTTYIQHGVALRVALQNGVKVFSFSNYQEFAKELTIGDWLHTKNSDNYANDFNKLQEKEEKLAQAESALSNRLVGIADAATAYMKKSAYSKSSKSIIPNMNGKVVIFLHDFFDSPHVYREMVFPDFWQWICFTIETFNNANIDFYIKPHPNQINLSGGVIAQLMSSYPAIKLVSSDINNKQLADAGIACAVTVYGTVAHEMAYLGIPTIACARHPHISFDFCRTAKNREDYAEMLKSYNVIEVDKLKLRQQSLMFYYMHNLSAGEGEKSLRNAYLNFHKVSGEADNENYELISHLNQIAIQPSFKNYLSKWLIELNG